MNPHPDFNDTLENRLRADARRARVTPPEGLEQRISAAVWRERDAGLHRPETRDRGRFARRLIPALLGLVATACGLTLAVVVRDRAEEKRAHEDMRLLAEAVQALPARLAAADLAVPTRWSVPQPLTREIDSVRADARTALGFLATNFLPSETRGGRLNSTTEGAPDTQES